MRPADELTANYNVATQNTLLWVYEGQTEYWGTVLSARSGLHTKEEALIDLAGVAAFYDTQPGRAWRALQDTDNHNLLGYRVPGQWTSWMRGTGDYYRESQLMWLDADTLIREGTRDRKSSRRLRPGLLRGRGRPSSPRAAIRSRRWSQALNGVYAHDWAGLPAGPAGRGRARRRRAPLDGITRAGWPPGLGRQPDGGGEVGPGRLGHATSSIRWASPCPGSGQPPVQHPLGQPGACRPGIGAGWELVAVDGTSRPTPEVLAGCGDGGEGHGHRPDGPAAEDPATASAPSAFELPRRPALPAPRADRGHARTGWPTSGRRAGARWKGRRAVCTGAAARVRLAAGRQQGLGRFARDEAGFWPVTSLPSACTIGAPVARLGVEARRWPSACPRPGRARRRSGRRRLPRCW